MEFTVGFIIGLLLATLGGAFVYLKIKAQLIAATAELDLLRSQVVQNESLSQNLTQDLSKQFEFIASKVFEEKSVRLNDQSMKSLTVLLDPFKERLKDFERLTGGPKSMMPRGQCSQR
jgi:DNA anti-recombination protein RmuC